jgi:pilus assembly protein CpaF
MPQETLKKITKGQDELAQNLSAAPILRTEILHNCSSSSSELNEKKEEVIEK